MDNRVLYLIQGETVLDLGSGGGMDVFLAARQVGITGHVIGLDLSSVGSSYDVSVYCMK